MAFQQDRKLDLKTNNDQIIINNIKIFLIYIEDALGSSNKLKMGIKMFNYIYNKRHIILNYSNFKNALFRKLKEIKYEINDLNIHIDLKQEWSNIYNKLVEIK